jgi:hypothetical protein
LFRALTQNAGRAMAQQAVQGYRSTFRDWAGEASHHPREVIKHALAHLLKDRSEASYQRGSHFDKRRALMQYWALHCDRVCFRQMCINAACRPQVPIPVVGLCLLETSFSKAKNDTRKKRSGAATR